MSVLTSQHIQHFRDAGYLIVRNCFTPQQIKHLNDLLEHILEQNISRCSSLHESMQNLRSYDTGLYSSLLNTFAKSSRVQKTFLSEKVLKIIKNLGVEEPSFITHPVTHVISEELYRSSPSSPVYGFRAHQDWASIQGSLNCVVCWIPLCKVEDNYPVQVIPGSHKEGLRPHIDIGNGFPEIITTDKERDNFISPELSPGDMLVFSSFLIHRTRPSTEGSIGFRSALSARFDDINNEYFRENKYYCAYKRTVDREIKSIPTNEELNFNIDKVR